MNKLAWCDVDTLNNGGVAYAMYIGEGGKPVNIQVVKDDNGNIRQVIKNGNLNPITCFYLQGGNNSEQMISKKDSRDIMAQCGGVVNLELSGGIDADKKPLAPRLVKVEFTYNEARGLGQYDPRSYDCKIISDGTTARLGDTFTL